MGLSILAWDRSINAAGLKLVIVAIESQPSKMKYHTVGKVPKYNKKIGETLKQKLDADNTHRRP